MAVLIIGADLVSAELILAGSKTIGSKPNEKVSLTNHKPFFSDCTSLGFVSLNDVEGSVGKPTLSSCELCANTVLNNLKSNIKNMNNKANLIPLLSKTMVLILY